MAMTLITTNTSSDAANSSFTSGIDSTYKLYIFKFIDINPATDDVKFGVNFSTDGGSNYNLTKTTTLFNATHEEDDSPAALTYTGNDLAQSTAYMPMTVSTGGGADESCAGTLWLFNPSNTTYVKHFYSRLSSYDSANGAKDFFMGGYVNSTSDVDAVDFKFDTGNMDGVISMYGVG
jgi:hypothetical protein